LLVVQSGFLTPWWHSFLETFRKTDGWISLEKKSRQTFFLTLFARHSQSSFNPATTPWTEFFPYLCSPFSPTHFSFNRNDDRTVLIWVVSKPEVLTFFVQNCFFGVLNRGSYEKKWDFSYKQDYLGEKNAQIEAMTYKNVSSEKLIGLVNQQRTIFLVGP
jgi:hypothetical protein